MRVYTYKNLEHVGRLGNQLWEVAWQIGQAAANGGRPAVKADWEYRKFFDLPEAAYVPPGPKDEVIDGGTLYYQELSHWWHVKDTVWQWFQPSEYAIDRLFERGYDEALLDYSVHKTSIHVRRGDYLKYPHLFPLPTKRYYREAMERVKSQHPHTLFVVFSDDIEWCKNNFSKDHNIMFVHGIPRPVDVKDRKGEPEDIYDLMLQASCDEHIIANSTFSWWAAFLSVNRHAYHPNVWWGQGLKNITDVHGRSITISWRDGIPDNWTEIQC